MAKTYNCPRILLDLMGIVRKKKYDLLYAVHAAMVDEQIRALEKIFEELQRHAK
jgi:hypothetical protein